MGTFLGCAGACMTPVGDWKGCGFMGPPGDVRLGWTRVGVRVGEPFGIGKLAVTATGSRPAACWRFWWAAMTWTGIWGGFPAAYWVYWRAAATWAVKSFCCWSLLIGWVLGLFMVGLCSGLLSLGPTWSTVGCCCWVAPFVCCWVPPLLYWLYSIPKGIAVVKHWQLELFWAPANISKLPEERGRAREPLKLLWRSMNPLTWNSPLRDYYC